MRVGEHRVGDEAEREQREHRVDHERQTSPVDRVGEHAAQRRERDVRHDLGQRDEPDRDGRVGERVDLVRDRDARRLAAELRERLGEDEPAQIGRAAQRGDVEEVRAQARWHARDSTRRGADISAARTAVGREPTLLAAVCL